MKKSDFERICMELVKVIRERCPRDTGKLADHGIQFLWEDEETFVIYVNESQAPYMPYTNEPWISPKWNGKKNPNEAWWQDATRLCAEYLKNTYNGKEE